MCGTTFGRSVGWCLISQLQDAPSFAVARDTWATPDLDDELIATLDKRDPALQCAEKNRALSSHRPRSSDQSRWKDDRQSDTESRACVADPLPFASVLSLSVYSHCSS